MVVLFCGWLDSGARAHEPYLRLTERPDGSVLAEAGFSDNADVAGLKLLVRDRATGATLAEHRLPAGGQMTLTPPAVPYRVVFEGGEGHRVSKVGPERAPVPPPVGDTAARAAESMSPPITPPSPAPVDSKSQTTSAAATKPALASAVRAGAGVTRTDDVNVAGDDTLRLVLVVGIVFLFGAVAFALGFGAGRRSR